MRPFDELGLRIEDALALRDFDEGALPEIATRALIEARLHETVRGDDVLRHVLRARHLPPQRDLSGVFGEPPVTVFVGRRFYIDVLFWRDGSTSIHRHGFQGAAMVLEGGSLHARWRFHPEDRVNSALLLGRCELLGCELLRRGDVFAITPELTHGLFHLERPSATVVVRTVSEQDVGPQYDLHPPGLALDPFFTDALQERRGQVLRLLRETAPERFREEALELAAASDLMSLHQLMTVSQLSEEDPALLEALAQAARPRHGARVDRLLPAVRERTRRSAILGLRAKVQDPGQRFFLALLLNLPDRASILGMVARWAPEADPLERVWGWLLALSGTELLGVDLSGPLEQILARQMLQGAPPERWREALLAAFDPETVHSQWEDVLDHADRMRSTLLGPLFVG